MTAEFWGGLAGALVVNVGVAIYLFGRVVERIDGLRGLITQQHEDHEKRITRVETFIDNRRSMAAQRS